jgi:hypothetical protein
MPTYKGWFLKVCSEITKEKLIWASLQQTSVDTKADFPLDCIHRLDLKYLACHDSYQIIHILIYVKIFTAVSCSNFPML